MRTAIVVCILLILMWIYYFFNSTTKIEVRKDVERVAAKKGVPVKKVYKLVNKFVEGVRFGGAGGIGAPIIIPETVEEMFYKVEIDENTWIAYAFREKTSKEGVDKDYWIVKQNPIIMSFVDHYDSPYFSPSYVKEINDDAIVFGRFPILECFLSFFLGLISLLIIHDEWMMRQYQKKREIEEKSKAPCVKN